MTFSKSLVAKGNIFQKSARLPPLNRLYQKSLWSWLFCILPFDTGESTLYDSFYKNSNFPKPTKSRNSDSSLFRGSNSNSNFTFGHRKDPADLWRMVALIKRDRLVLKRDPLALKTDQLALKRDLLVCRRMVQPIAFGVSFNLNLHFNHIDLWSTEWGKRDL